MGAVTAGATTGGCLCGAVRYRLAEPPAGYGACHCGMCRRWGGGVDLTVQVMPGGIEWEGGEPATYRSSDWAERGFCPRCGSSLFWRLVAAGPMQGMLSLSAGSLDSMEGLGFDVEVYIDHKPESYAFAGERRRMAEAEVLAMMGVAPGGGAA